MAKITFITIRKTFLVYSPKKNLKRKFCEEMSQFWFNQERNWTVRALVQSNYPQNWCLWFPRKKKKGINKKWTKKVSFWFRDNVASNQFSWEKQTAKSWHPLQLYFIFIFNGIVQKDFITIISTIVWGKRAWDTNWGRMNKKDNQTSGSVWFS